MTTERGEVTPGPWSAEWGKAIGHYVNDATGRPVAAMMHGGQAEWDDAILSAHADLIAAAPDLLGCAQLARMVLSTLNEGFAPAHPEDAIRELDAAIDKALGTKP